MKAEDIELEMTCGACPEQYEAYHYNDDHVGYLRLRHGHFYVEGKDRKIVYEAIPKGDGIFHDDEREKYLSEAKRAIAESYN